MGVRWIGLVVVGGCVDESGRAAGAREVEMERGPADGVRFDKDRVYVVAKSVNLEVVGQSDVAVSCDDDEDVLLSGACNVLGDGNLSVFEAFGTGLDDPALAATWHCGVDVTEVVPSLTAASASALCVRVR